MVNFRYFDVGPPIINEPNDVIIMQFKLLHIMMQFHVFIVFTFGTPVENDFQKKATIDEFIYWNIKHTRDLDIQSINISSFQYFY